MRRAGENVAAAEVENVLRSHPAVLEAAVVAVPDELRGEEVKAYVALVEASRSSRRRLLVELCATARQAQGAPLHRVPGRVSADTLDAGNKSALLAEVEDPSAGAWDREPESTRTKENRRKSHENGQKSRPQRDFHPARGLNRPGRRSRAIGGVDRARGGATAGFVFIASESGFASPFAMLIGMLFSLCLAVIIGEFARSCLQRAPSTTTSLARLRAEGRLRHGGDAVWRLRPAAALPALRSSPPSLQRIPRRAGHQHRLAVAGCGADHLYPRGADCRRTHPVAAGWPLLPRLRDPRLRP